jgi:glycosyltransferase involved in cell wall biosynthesis
MILQPRPSIRDAKLRHLAAVQIQMPIASIHIDTRPDWRGGQNQVLLTLLGLKRRGQAVELLALAGGALERRARDEGFQVHAIPSSSVRWGGSLLLRKLMQARRYEIVHAHDPHGLTLAWLARAHRRAILIAQRRVANPLSRGPFALARYRAAKRILAVSKFIAESVIASGIAANQVEVIYEGVKLPDRTTPSQRATSRDRWNVAEADILLGCVGYLLPEKGQEVLIRALSVIQKDFPSCRLLLAGDGPSRPELEKLAGDLNISRSIIFAGFIEQIENVYHGLDIFLFPSLAEPLGTSMLAAMSHGLPVIGVASGGVPEIVASEKNGLLVASPDPEAIATSVKRLLHNRQEAAKFGEAARATIEERFTDDRMVEATIGKYQALLTNS